MPALNPAQQAATQGNPQTIVPPQPCVLRRTQAHWKLSTPCSSDLVGGLFRGLLPARLTRQAQSLCGSVSKNFIYHACGDEIKSRLK